MFRKRAAQPSPFDKVESLENRAARDFFDPGSPDATYRAGRAIPSSARVAAYHLINTQNKTVGESKLFALVDAVAFVLAHDGSGGSLETARLALETVVPPATALAAVRALAENDRAV